MAELTQVPISNREFDNYEGQHFPTEWANSVPSKKDATKTLVPNRRRKVDTLSETTAARTLFLLFFAVVPASSLPAFVRQNFRSTFFCVFPFLTLVVTCGEIDLLLEAAFFSVWRRRTKDIWDGECRLSGRVRERMLQKTFIAST